MSNRNSDKDYTVEITIVAPKRSWKRKEEVETVALTNHYLSYPEDGLEMLVQTLTHN